MGNVVYKTGDIFTTTLPAFGHGVNTQGVMGSGIAVAVRTQCHDIFDAYKEACLSRKLRPGGMLPLYSEATQKWVLNMASQELTGRNAQLDWLVESTYLAFDFAEHKKLEGFALPRIGSGIGGLNWNTVDEAINRIAKEYPDIKLEIWSLPGA